MKSNEDFIYYVDTGKPIQNVGLYDRASSKPQATNYARSANKDELEKFANKHQFAIKAIGFDVCSGSMSDKNSRPVFYSMAKSQDIDTIVVYSADRFSRDPGASIQLENICRLFEKNLIILQNEIDLEVMSQLNNSLLIYLKHFKSFRDVQKEIARLET